MDPQKNDCQKFQSLAKGTQQINYEQNRCRIQQQQYCKSYSISDEDQQVKIHNNINQLCPEYNQDLTSQFYDGKDVKLNPRTFCQTPVIAQNHCNKIQNNHNQYQSYSAGTETEIHQNNSIYKNKENINQDEFSFAHKIQLSSQNIQKQSLYRNGLSTQETGSLDHQKDLNLQDNIVSQSQFQISKSAQQLQDWQVEGNSPQSQKLFEAQRLKNFDTQSQTPLSQDDISNFSKIKQFDLNKNIVKCEPKHKLISKKNKMQKRIRPLYQKKLNSIKKLKTLDLTKKDEPHEINAAISRVTLDEVVHNISQNSDNHTAYFIDFLRLNSSNSFDCLSIREQQALRMQNLREVSVQTDCQLVLEYQSNIKENLLLQEDETWRTIMQLRQEQEAFVKRNVRQYLMNRPEFRPVSSNSSGVRENQCLIINREIERVYQEKQQELKHHRSLLVSWIIQMHNRFQNLRQETVHIGAHLIEFMYLKQSSLLNHSDSMRILSIASLLIASKFEDIEPPQPLQLLEIAGLEQDKIRQVTDLEKTILHKIDFNLTIPTSRKFVEVFGQLCGFSQLHLDYSEFILEISLLDSEFVASYKQSLLAMATISLVAERISKITNQTLKVIARTMIQRIKSAEDDLTPICTLEVRQLSDQLSLRNQEVVEKTRMYASQEQLYSKNQIQDLANQLLKFQNWIFETPDYCSVVVDKYNDSYWLPLLQGNTINQLIA